MKKLDKDVSYKLECKAAIVLIVVMEVWDVCCNKDRWQAVHSI